MVLFHGIAIFVNYVLLFLIIPPIIFFLDDKWNPFVSYITSSIQEWLKKIIIKIKPKDYNQDSEIKENVDNE